MKTAISVSDETGFRVDQLAKKHGMNRSQFYAAAAERYADDLESEDLTAAINAVVDMISSDDSSAFAISAGQTTLGSPEEEW